MISMQHVIVFYPVWFVALEWAIAGLVFWRLFVWNLRAWRKRR